VQAAGAKLLMVGDHRQLAAVGAGGGMDLVAAAGPSYELAEARRFAADWERTASLQLREGDPAALDAYHRRGRLVDSGTVEQAERQAARAWLADTIAGKRSLLIVDTNEQAARLSAQIRAHLVALGRVAEAGVPLGLQGTYAGVGDLVQARRNGWHLTGYEGNTRPPINRETYRVLHTRDDGGLIVAPILGRSAEGEQLGPQMSLPGDYVAAHVALGYASTVHAAQGTTIDTGHGVVTPGTGADALYVELTRGIDSNTAYVASRIVPADAPAGAVAEAVRRSPLAVLAGILDSAEPDESALAFANRSEHDATSVRTPAELLVDAAELATAGRTARWLDGLAAAGDLTSAQRVALAAEDGAATLTRVLRRAELAGHDPQAVLRQAITSRPLDDARQLANVLHDRIAKTVSLDPAAHTYAEWVPSVEHEGWRRYLASLAEAADTRRRELGDQVADQQPQWALESLGPVPQTDPDRAAWKLRAGIVAAHRELTGHEDDATALGLTPKAGEAEAYASWRAAWQALGRPEADRDEIEMSDGDLRVRVRAYQREQTWAPRYVANELAGAHQALQQHQTTAALRTAEAGASTDPATRELLKEEAAQATAVADVLAAQITRLEAADAARAEWLAHTATTRAAADRATAELQDRLVVVDQSDDRVTADEWLVEHLAALAEEDQHRPIRDAADLADVAGQRTADLADTTAQRDADLAAADQQLRADMVAAVTSRKAETTTDAGQRKAEMAAAIAQRKAEIASATAERRAAMAEAIAERQAAAAAAAAHRGAGLSRGVRETDVADIRDTAAAEAPQTGEDDVRVPSAAESAGTVERAQRALREIRQREAADAQREAQTQRAEQLTRWRAADKAAAAELATTAHATAEASL
jgi:hypothetical protein